MKGCSVCVYIAGWAVSIVHLFFFQAEDGIRDDLVTGVQTCALPISHRVLVGPVMARYYEFALRPLKVAAPIRNKAIVAHRWLVAEVASFAPVAKDGMVGYPLRQGQVRQGRDEAVFGIEKIDAVGHLLELFACGIRLRQAEGFGVARQHIAGTADYY